MVVYHGKTTIAECLKNHAIAATASTAHAKQNMTN